MKLLHTFVDTMLKNIAVTEYTFHKSISVGHKYQNKFDQSVGYGLVLAVSEEMYKSESTVRYITNTVSQEIKKNGSIKGTTLNLCNNTKDMVSIKKGEDPEIKKPFNFISSNARHKNFVICGFKTDFCFLDEEIFSMNDLVSVYATIDSLLMGISIQNIVENKVCCDVQLTIKNKDATTEHINECKILLLNGKTFECVSENFSDFFSINIKEIKGK